MGVVLVFELNCDLWRGSISEPLNCDLDRQWAYKLCNLDVAIVLKMGYRVAVDLWIAICEFEWLEIVTHESLWFGCHIGTSAFRCES